MSDTQIGRNVRNMREFLGIDQTELARRLGDAGLRGFHQTTVSRIEKGERPVRLSEAPILAEVLHGRIGDLIDEPDRTGAEHYQAGVHDALVAVRDFVVKEMAR
jgi:transcriptional regulator with XRE-family HTH domain